MYLFPQLISCASQNKADKVFIYHFTHWSQHGACLLWNCHDYVIDVIFSLMKAGVNRHNSIKVNWRTSFHHHKQGKGDCTISQTRAKLASEHTFNTWDHSYSWERNTGVLSKKHWRLSEMCLSFKLFAHHLKCITHLWFSHYESRVSNFILKIIFTWSKWKSFKFKPANPVSARPKDQVETFPPTNFYFWRAPDCRGCCRRCKHIQN